MLVRRMQTVTACLLACLVTCLIVPDAAAQGETSAVTFADGDYALQVPAAWPSQPPRSQMIQYEFQIPADEGNAGRLTMMSAGGSIRANLDRWAGQFPEGTHDVEVSEVADCKIHQLSAKGTFQDRPKGPFGPTVDREQYRMLAAIIETPEHGNFFVKAYGPQDLMDRAEPAFAAMLQSLQHMNE